ncbi:MAG: hypothetical protein IJO48_04750 [Clostridia bacterium]|nr:hypothetical protein [Clostridia bacterium]
MVRLTVAKRTVLGAMTVALTVLCVYAAAVLPTMRAVAYFISSLFVYVLVCEKAYGAAVLSYIASAVLSFVLIPDKIAILPYVLLLGHFGIFKVFIDRKITDKFVGFVFKLIYCNVFTLIALLLIMYVFNISDFVISVEIPLWVIITAAQVIFVVFNYVYTLCQQFYDTRLRSVIVSQR